MNDVFISYATADRDRIRPLVNALEQRGWSVWWDRTILAGQRWEDVIEAALNEARCVIVLWSSASIQSEWVRAEADEGRRRHVLVPALLDDVKIPLAFRGIQAASLVGWSGATDSPEFEALAKAVREVLGAPAADGTVSGPPHDLHELPPRQGFFHRYRRPAMLAGAVLLAGLVGSAWYAFRSHPPAATQTGDSTAADSSAQGDLLRAGLDGLLQKYAGYLRSSGFAAVGSPPTISLTSKGDLNSYYEPSTRRIVMDEALARWPFVGLREYTHYVLFTTRKDVATEPTGLESGLADYFPSSFSNRSDSGREVWDLFRERNPGVRIPDRNLDNQRNFAEIAPGRTEEHDAGTVWGGAFWQLRQAAGKEVTDRLLTSAWKSFEVRQGPAGLAAFPRELVRQDTELNHGRFAGQIRDIFEKRGLPL